MTDLSRDGFWVMPSTGKVVRVKTASRKALGAGGQVNQGFTVQLGTGNLLTTPKLNFSRPAVKGPNTRSKVGGGALTNRPKLVAGNRQRGQLRGTRAASASGFRSKSRTII